MHARARPAEQLEALFAGGWPAFIQTDAVAAQHVPTVRERFSDLEVVLLQDGVLVAAAWGVPISWDGTSSDLPRGYSDALIRSVAGHQCSASADTLVLCAAQVRPDVERSGLARAVLRGLIDVGQRAGLSQVVAPLRPTLKHRYPLIPIEEYVRWTRPDGTAFDPWLRTHLGMGGRLLGTSPASQVFTGTVEQWQGWSNLALPGDGAYVVPDALSPLHVDHEHNQGTCTEPTIWVRHR